MGTPQQLKNILSLPSNSLPQPITPRNAERLSPREREMLQRESDRVPFREYEGRGLAETVTLGGGQARLEGTALARYRIDKTLELVYRLIGLKPVNWPDKEGKKLLISFILRVYPGFTPEDIYTAFDYALQDLFPAELRLYDRAFNAEYVNGVLRAYAVYKGAAVKKAATLLEASRLDRPNKIRERSRLNAAAVTFALVHEYTRFYNEEPRAVTDYLRGDYYDFLDDLGLCTLAPAEIGGLLKMGAGFVARLDGITKEAAAGTLKAKNHAKVLGIRRQFAVWKKDGYLPDDLAEVLASAASYVSYSHHAENALYLNGHIDNI